MRWIENSCLDHSGEDGAGACPTDPRAGHGTPFVMDDISNFPWGCIRIVATCFPLPPKNEKEGGRNPLSRSATPLYIFSEMRAQLMSRFLQKQKRDSLLVAPSFIPSSTSAMFTSSARTRRCNETSSSPYRGNRERMKRSAIMRYDGIDMPFPCVIILQTVLHIRGPQDARKK